MPDSTDVNTGFTASIVMIVLTLAFTFLVISFYRRYKRASKPDNDQE